MKKYFIPIILSLLIMCFCCQAVFADNDAKVRSVYEDAAALVADIPTTQSFSMEEVSAQDLETILAAGINAPSAMNKQPWHFSVITDTSVMEMISGDMSFGRPAGPSGAGAPPEGFTPPEGFAPPAGDRPMPPAGAGMAAKAGIADAPLVIVISAPEGSDFDAGLACQNMYACAQLLGYGSKIISSPTMALNGEKQGIYRELLGIPENYRAVAVLLIGNDASVSGDVSVDAVTGATARNPLEEVVSFIRP